MSRENNAILGTKHISRPVCISSKIMPTKPSVENNLTRNWTVCVIFSDSSHICMAVNMHTFNFLDPYLIVYITDLKLQPEKMNQAKLNAGIEETFQTRN